MTPEAWAGVTMVAALAFAAGLGGIGFYVGTKTTGKNAGTSPASPTPASTTSPAVSVAPHVAAGAHEFVRFACAQCHGLDGRGGVSPDVPALTAAGKALTPAQLRTIIDHGVGAPKDPAKPFMPVWGPVISTKQVSDLVAYIRAGLPAVPDATPISIPRGQGAAVAGAALYEQYGCINCHGPNGLGGVPNPQAPDKTVPALSGADFFKEFSTDKKIADFIRSGSVLGRAPIVSMPHWGGIIPGSDLDALVAYVKTLKRS